MPGDSDESSRCLLFMFVIVPQFEVFVDALLSAEKFNKKKLKLIKTEKGDKYCAN